MKSIVTFLFVLLSTGEVSAQLQLDFRRVVNNWPIIELYFTTACDSVPIYFRDKRNIRVREGEVEQNFDIWCPDPFLRCPTSVTMVFETGSFLAVQDFLEAKKSGKLFIDELDGVIDEASVVSTDSVTVMNQQMTTIRPLLNASIDSLKKTSWSMTFDALYEGLRDLIGNSVNPCRAVVLFTSGKDSGSIRSISQVSDLATRNRIKIYVLGFGDNVDSITVKQIAMATGGRFIHKPSAKDIAELYREISTIIFDDFQECLITYTAKCMDGSRRTVGLSVIDTCGGSSTQEKTYKAPRDTSEFTALSISIATTRTEEDSTVRLSVTLDPAVVGDSLRAASFILPYDSSLLSFEGVYTDASTILQDSLLQYTAMPGRVEFVTKSVYLTSVSSVLLKLVFKTRNVSDITQTTLLFTSWNFIHGCYNPHPKEGIITIHPKGTLSAGIVAQIGAPVLHQNYPNPFNPSTVIEYKLTVTTHARLVVYDALGRELRVLVNERQEAGLHRATFDAEDLPSGVYAYKLETSGVMRTRYMLILH